jgi:hypothetical protein
VLTLARLASSTELPRINLSVHLALDLHTPENSEECVVRKSAKEASGIQANYTLLAGQVHYHCAMGELQMVGSANELLSNMREYSDSKAGTIINT